MHPFDIKAHLKESWNLVDGSKWPVWAPLLVLIAISIGIGIFFTLLSALFGLPLFQGGFTTGFSVGYVVIAFIIEVITLFVTAPLVAGAQMVALKRVRSESVEAKSGFQYWHLWVNLGITLVLVSLGVGLINVVFGALITVAFKVGFWLAVIFQVLALVAFIIYYAFVIFAVLFVADKNNSPIEAFVNCHKMVRPHWLHISKVIVCVGVGLLIVFLPYFLLSLTGYGLLSLLGLVISAVLAVWAIPWFHLIISGIFNKLAE